MSAPGAPLQGLLRRGQRGFLERLDGHVNSLRAVILAAPERSTFVIVDRAGTPSTELQYKEALELIETFLSRVRFLPAAEDAKPWTVIVRPPRPPADKP